MNNYILILMAFIAGVLKMLTENKSLMNKLIIGVIGVAVILELPAVIHAIAPHGLI